MDDDTTTTVHRDRYTARIYPKSGIWLYVIKRTRDDGSEKHLGGGWRSSRAKAKRAALDAITGWRQAVLRSEPRP